MKVLVRVDPSCVDSLRVLTPTRGVTESSAVVTDVGRCNIWWRKPGPRRRGEDIHVGQRLIGHSNIAKTSRCLHLSDADLLAAVDRAFPES